MKRTIKIGLIAASFGIMLSAGISVGTAVNAFALTPCEHDYNEIVIESTCTAQGFTEYTCKLCGDTYRDDYKAANGHTFSEVVVPATCTDKGFTTHFCKECGYQYSDNYINATGHDYTDVVYEPTCTEIGYTVHTCGCCKDEYTDSYTDAKGHRYTEEVVAATCTENGYTKYTCEDCGDTFTGNETDATGHEYKENTVKATCVAYGFTEHICEACKTRYVTDYVKPLGHDYTEKVIPATDEQLGFTKHTCKTCGYVYLSDFSSSKDNGYIEVPEEPKPEVHVHSYVLSVAVNRTDKTITLDFDCACGETGSDLVTVLFTDSIGEIVSKKPVDGIVDYSFLTGDAVATVVDGYGNVLKEIITGTGETPTTPDKPVESDKPDNPEQPGEDGEKHTYLFKGNLYSEENYILFNYECTGCGQDMTDTLTAYFTSAAGETVALAPDKNGKIDFSELKGAYTVLVADADGIIIADYTVKINETSDEPQNPDDSGSSDEPDPPDNSDSDDGKKNDGKKGNALKVVLPLIAVLLIAGGAAVVVIIKKKDKNKKK